MQIVEAEPVSEGFWDYSKDGKVWKSCAVIASDGDARDILLHAFGPSIDYHIDEGLTVDELELHAPESGIWVWEGSMGTDRVDSYEAIFGYDYEYKVEGVWRKPSPREWEAIQKGECPWDKETLPKWGK